MAFNPAVLNESTIKRFVDQLVKHNKTKTQTSWPPKRSAVQEDVAVMLGYKNWHELSKCVKDATDKIAAGSQAAPVKTVPDTKQRVFVDLPDIQLFLTGFPFFEAGGCLMRDGTHARLSSEEGKRAAAWMSSVAEHSLVYGSDTHRRAFFENVIDENPDLRFFVVQGRQSLPVRQRDHLAFHSISDNAYYPFPSLGALSKQFLLNYIRSRIERFQYPQAMLSFVDMVYRSIGDDLHKEDPNFLQSSSWLTFFNPLSEPFKWWLAKQSGKTQTQINSLLHRFNNQDLKHILDNIEHILRKLPPHLYTFDRNTNVGLNLSTWDTPGSMPPIATAIEHWRLSSSQPGIVIFNGLPHDSEILQHIYSYFSMWGEHNIGVFVGANSAADLPNGPKEFERLTSRLKWKLELS